MLAVLLGAAFGLGWLPAFVFRAEALREALPLYSAAEQRSATLTPLILALHVSLACALVSFTNPLPPRRAAVGIVLFALGFGFWLWGRLQISPLRQKRLPDQPPLHLRRDGAFGLVRNPLYFAYLLMAAAPVLVSAQPLAVFTWLAAFAALAVRAEQEERRLHAQVGPAYADYCRRVKRLIPFVW